MNKIACIAYIAFVTGMAVTTVGEMPESPLEPYPWWFPLVILSIMLVILSMMVAPAISEYLAGRDDERRERRNEMQMTDEEIIAAIRDIAVTFTYVDGDAIIALEDDILRDITIAQVRKLFSIAEAA